MAYVKTFKKEFCKFQKNVQDRIFEFLGKVADNPLSGTILHGKMRVFGGAELEIIE